MRLIQTAVVGLILGLGLTGCLSNPPPAAPADGQPAEMAFFTDAINDAKPYLDVVGGRLVETQASLIAEIRVTEHDPDKISAVAAADGYAWGLVYLCWGRWDDPTTPWVDGDQCAGVEFESVPDAQPRGFYDMTVGPDANCNDWWYCAWHVPFEVIPGSPATVRVVVPRELLANASVGHTLEGPFVGSKGAKADTSSPSARTGRSASANVCVPARCVAQDVVPTENFDRDQSDRGPDYNLQLRPVGLLGMPSPKTLIVDRTHDIATPAQGYRADLDVLFVDIEETSTGFAYITTVASLPAAAFHEFDMELAVAGTTYEAWYQARAGQLSDVQGGYCADLDCGGWTEFTPEVELKPGTPGAVRVAVKWADLLPVPKGSLVTFAEVELGELVSSTYAPIPRNNATVRSNGIWDGAFPAEPYYMMMGSGT